jgi:hypothetical protein
MIVCSEDYLLESGRPNVGRRRRTRRASEKGRGLGAIRPSTTPLASDYTFSSSQVSKNGAVGIDLLRVVGSPEGDESAVLP